MARSSTLKSPWRTASDRAADREEKRVAVLQAAAAAFAESGYHGTSLDGIAARLGVTKPTLYYYARNKDELANAVAESALNRILEAMEGDERASALSQLQHLLRRYAEVTTTDAGRCIAVIRDARSTGLVSDHLRECLRRIDRRIRNLLERGAEDGSIARCDVKLTAFMIAGAINGISGWFDPAGPMSGALIAEKIVNQISAGLIPR